MGARPITTHMLEIVTGQSRNAPAERELIRVLQTVPMSGTLYIGYPIIGSTDEPVTIDALLTTNEHGVVIFDYAGDASSPELVSQISDRQNDIHAAIYQKLFSHKPLRSGRTLAIPVQVITLTPIDPPGALPAETIITTAGGLRSVLKALPSISADLFRSVNAAIQRIATIKPANKRMKVSKSGSRGAIMQRIEREIANLDQWQKKAAIESPDGPQRIRGLAGSGKTVVLALKAAYLHARNPQWNIIVTFNTRALYQQFQDLIRRFCFEQLNDEPDWTKLRLLHAWGSGRQPGVYSEIASSNGLVVRDFAYARQMFSYATAFGGVCDELLAGVESRTPTEIFDAVLIDEAQDLPPSFFELIYLSTRDPKRIVWAYDELQNLGAYTMVPPAELFGSKADGSPRVADLQPDATGARRDIILPVCYRNTPWALTVAHSLGFGIYRREGLIQFFDDPNLWFDVGYAVAEGALEPGAEVTLARRPDASPRYFRELLTPDDAVQFHTFNTKQEQVTWVAQQIKHNVTEDELDEKDIVVILADALTAKKEAARLIEALDLQGLSAHLAGVTGSVDQLFEDGSIAITGIFRAKGNEAPMVYIVNADYCASPYIPIKGRNTLFTAITRSRAWARVCGTGSGMASLTAELQAVRDNEYRLRFRVPTTEELGKLRRIHRDMSKAEIEEVERIQTALTAFSNKLKTGEIAKEHLPKELIRDLATLLKSDDEE